jgi:hypothetical protein
MAKFKAYDYRQRVFLPVSLENQLMPGTLEFAIHTLVDQRLDMSIFAGKYHNDETGRTAYDPGAFVEQTPSANTWQCRWAPKVLIFQNRWRRKSTPKRDAGYTRNDWPSLSLFSPTFGLTSD